MVIFQGHADLNAPNVCGECQCAPPSGSCDLPATLTASSTSCPGVDPSAVHTPFDPPSAWDGGCTTNDAVPAGQLCDGGDCVQSLTIGPLTVNETGCAPTQYPSPQTTPATWGTFVRACRGLPFGSCTPSGDICAGENPPGAGFRVCVDRDGDVPCSAFGPYQERHVFYDDYQDTRSCSACTCDAPAGSVCSTEVSIFTDDACASLASYVLTLDSSKPACHDLVAGTALASKSASTPTYAPGGCQPSGGEALGSANPVGPTTICCIPPL